MSAKKKTKGNKIVRVISSTHLRSLESKKSSRFSADQRPKFADTINARPLFNPIAGP